MRISDWSSDVCSSDLRIGMPVSGLAKWKTTIQMLALGFLIVGDAVPAPLSAAMIGEIGIWIAAALTLFTGYDYLRAGLVHMTDGSPRPAGEENGKPDRTKTAGHTG